MKFKCSKGSPAYDMVDALMSKADAAVEASNKLAEEFGVEQYYGHGFYLYGGMEAIVIKPGAAKPGKGWLEYENEENAFKPDLRTKIGRENKKKMNALPTVLRKNLVDCVGCNAKFIAHPGLTWSKDKEHYLIDYPEKWGMPKVEGWVEITTSEYNELKSDE